MSSQNKIDFSGCFFEVPRRISSLTFFFASLISFVPMVNADGVSIDKVYDPYVDYLEREIELRSAFYQYDNNQSDKALHRLGVGYGFSPNFFAEIYFIGEKEQDGTLTLDAYEVEAKWQFTEQGEYLFDWAFLFEFEDKKNTDVFELATTLISSVDVGRWTGIANLSLIYEWSEDIQNEFETAFSVQWRYRYRREIEGGLEFYLAQDTKALGPILMGSFNLEGRKKIFWDLAAIYGLESGDSALTPDLTLKGSLEFEF